MNVEKISFFPRVVWGAGEGKVDVEQLCADLQIHAMDHGAQQSGGPLIICRINDAKLFGLNIRA